MSRTASEDKLDSGMIIVSSDSLETKWEEREIVSLH